MLRCTIRICLLTTVFVVSSTTGQIVHSAYGLDFLRVGDAGNRSPNPTEFYSPLLPQWSPGSVNYEYAISRTELSAGQYLEFANAILPHWQGHPYELSGQFIQYSTLQNRFVVFSDAVNQNYAEGMTFWNAARYANWLHNGKVNEAWAFQTGAYDIPQLGNDPSLFDGNPIQRLPGAKYWIPSEDEWVKAVFWDTQKDGVGGYWPLPHGSDVPLMPGLPGEGETPVGLGSYQDFPIGSYPDTQSPWGLVDVSGGWLELTDTAHVNTFIRTWGSSNNSPPDADWFNQQLPGHRRLTLEGAALRIATNVPTPGSLAAVGCALIFAARRRR